MKPTYFSGTETDDNVGLDDGNNRNNDFPFRGSFINNKGEVEQDQDSSGEAFAECIMSFPKRRITFLKLLDKLQKEFSESPDLILGERVKVGNTTLRPTKNMINGQLHTGPSWDIMMELFLGSKDFKPMFECAQVTNDTFSYLFPSKGFECPVFAEIEKILADGDIHFNGLRTYHVFDLPFILSINDIPLWLSFLKSRIPVRLVDEKEIDKNLPNFLKRSFHVNNDNVNCVVDASKAMELLGCYNVKETGEILLCPKRITNVSKCLQIPEEHLFIAVYIHELAHAAMDSKVRVDEIGESIYSISWGKDKSDFDQFFTTQDNPAFAMEESLANMIMLSYLEWYCEDNQELYNNARKFVECQMPEYAFGAIQFDADVDWRKWKEYKANFNGNQEQIDKLKKWYDKWFLSKVVISKTVENSFNDTLV